MRKLKTTTRTQGNKNVHNQKSLCLLLLGFVLGLVCYHLIHNFHSLPTVFRFDGRGEESQTAQYTYQSTTTTLNGVKSYCEMTNFPNEEVTIGDVCKCVSTLKTDGMPIIDAIWNHDYIQQSLRQAARASLFDCWNWPNAIADVNRTKADFANITDRMIHLLNRHTLSKSIKTRASPLVLERVVQVVLRRLADPANNPPLKIAVFGGSVTSGFNSMRNSMGLRDNAMLNFPKCAWSCKLERLLNQILVGLLPSSSSPMVDKTSHRMQSTDKSTQEVPLDKIVTVTNYAVGGVDSEGGATMLEYNLFNADMRQYDIFVASFGANDIQAPDGFVRDRIFEYMQKFMRLAKAQRPCNDLPLVIQLDDVLGDSLRPTVRHGLRYSQEMIESNNWAGFMSVSYADAVRDVVYDDPADTILHEYGELHPGFNFHTGVAWILTYNFLHGMVDACTAKSLSNHEMVEPRAGYPPPILRDNLLREEATKLWKKKAKEQSQLCAHNKTRSSCAYNWVAAKLGATTKEEVQAAITKVATNIDGWEAIGFPVRKPRRTWIATGLNSTFTIELDDLKTPINRMLVLVRRPFCLCR